MEKPLPPTPQGIFPYALPNSTSPYFPTHQPNTKTRSDIPSASSPHLSLDMPASLQRRPHIRRPAVSNPTTRQLPPLITNLTPHALRRSSMPESALSHHSAHHSSAHHLGTAPLSSLSNTKPTVITSHELPPRSITNSSAKHRKRMSMPETPISRKSSIESLSPSFSPSTLFPTIPTDTLDIYTSLKPALHLVTQFNPNLRRRRSMPESATSIYSGVCSIHLVYPPPESSHPGNTDFRETYVMHPPAQKEEVPQVYGRAGVKGKDTLSVPLKRSETQEVTALLRKRRNDAAKALRS